MGDMPSRGLKPRLCWQVSALVLLVGVGWAGGAAAADPGGVWFEFGGGYNFDSGGPLVDLPVGGVQSPQPSVRPLNDWDVDAKLGYQPSGSPWSFDVAVKYGRTRRWNGVDSGIGPSTSLAAGRQTFHTTADVTHTMVDFEVGHDVGIGAHSQATLGAGVRYARFDAEMRGTFFSSTVFGFGQGPFHIQSTSNLVGPRLFARGAFGIGSSNFAVGWGAGAAILFGRESLNSVSSATPPFFPATFPNFLVFSSGQTETVPNLDGDLRLDYHSPGTPVTLSFGYRVDSYFGALNGGLFSPRKVDVIEHGPFVSMVWKLP